MRELYRLSGLALNVPWFGNERDKLRLYWEVGEGKDVCTGSCVEVVKYAQERIDSLEGAGYVVTGVGHP